MKKRIEDSIARILAEDKGSFYLYDRETIDEKIEELTSAFCRHAFLYSIKTNPFPDVVEHILGKGIGADAASAGEVELALRLGAKRENIYYSAPGKTRSDIEAALGKCNIIADSYSEIALIDAVAGERGINVEIGVRLNPDFSMFGDVGDSSKFGIDEETLECHRSALDSCKSVAITGIHVHLRSQILDEQALARYYRRIFVTAGRCVTKLGWDMKFINFGGGLGIPYSTKRDTPLCVPKLAETCVEIIREYDQLAETRLLIETGRYLVCECGWYVAPVVDIKESRGTTYVIIQNGLNGFLRPAVAALLQAAGGDLSGFSAEPLFTKTDAFDFTVLGKDDSLPKESVTVVGNLCTATDTLASDIALPKVEIGDLIVLSKAGSYAYSLTPLLFSSQPIPEQYLL